MNLKFPREEFEAALFLGGALGLGGIILRKWCALGNCSSFRTELLASNYVLGLFILMLFGIVFTLIRHKKERMAMMDAYEEQELLNTEEEVSKDEESKETKTEKPEQKPAEAPKNDGIEKLIQQDKELKEKIDLLMKKAIPTNKTKKSSA